MFCKIFFIAVVAVAAFPAYATADDWKCEVILCLADARGAKTETECQPPIDKLIAELSQGRPFPVCDMGSTSANRLNHAVNEYLTIDTCAPQFIQYNSDNIPLYCIFDGRITVTVNGAPWTRVWWNRSNGFYTERAQ